MIDDSEKESNLYVKKWYVDQKCHFVEDKIKSAEDKINLQFESAAAAILLKAQQDLVVRTELEKVIDALKIKDEAISDRMNLLFGFLIVALLALASGLVILFTQHVGA